MYNQSNLYNQYYGQPRYQQTISPIQSPMLPINDTKPMGLQGKLIDSIDVAKAMDINLDGSISYFPLTDGSAIITKQLQTDGTSKTIIYKPSDDNIKETKYVTPNELEKALKRIDLSDIKDEIDTLKKQIKKLKNGDN